MKSKKKYKYIYKNFELIIILLIHRSVAPLKLINNAAIKWTLVSFNILYEYTIKKIKTFHSKNNIVGSIFYIHD